MALLNASSLLDDFKAPFMIGASRDFFSSCYQLGVSISNDSFHSPYNGWASNVTSLLPVLQKIPPSMKNGSLALICIDDDSVYSNFPGICPMSKHNLTQTTKDELKGYPYSPEQIISNFTHFNPIIPDNETIRLASPLNGISACGHEVYVNWLYAGDKSGHAMVVKSKGPTWGSDFANEILKIPNATEISHLSITCTTAEWARWMGQCDLHSSSYSTHVSILLTLLLVSMSMLFVNGLFV